MPENVRIDWIKPAYFVPAPDPLGVIQAALAQPVDGKTITELVRRKISIPGQAGRLRDGGVAILVAQNPEGAGSRAYEEFMLGVNSIPQVFEKFQAQGFRVGPHKSLPGSADCRTPPGDKYHPGIKVKLEGHLKRTANYLQYDL